MKTLEYNSMLRPENGFRRDYRALDWQNADRPSTHPCSIPPSDRELQMLLDAVLEESSYKHASSKTPSSGGLEITRTTASDTYYRGIESQKATPIATIYEPLSWTTMLKLAIFSLALFWAQAHHVKRLLYNRMVEKGGRKDVPSD